MTNEGELLSMIELSSNNMLNVELFDEKNDNFKII